MTVYVDPLKDWGWRLGPSCHMIADTDEELHAMADAVGMKRSWAQEMGNPNRYMRHYDLVASRRKRAVALGAVEISHRQWAEMMVSERRGLEARE